MGVNNNGNNGNGNNWKDEQGPASEQRNNNNAPASMNNLLALLTQTSSTFTGRVISEMAPVQKKLNEIFKQRKDDKLNTIKSTIVPEIDVVDQSLSPILPGIVLWLKMGDIIFVAPFLFYSSKLIVDVEEVSMISGNQNHRVNVPKTPASYIDKRLNQELIQRFKQNHGKHIEVVQIAGGIVNLELYADVRNDESRLVERITGYIDREWESGVLTNVVRNAAEQPGIKLPSPFHSKQPYGANGTADARISPINSPILGENGVILPSNMEVSVVTTNPNRYNQNNPNVDATPREVCRVEANVTLLPVNHQEYLNNLRRANVNPMGLGGPANDGWRPFRPAIALNTAIAGPQMNSNGGLIPFLMGLHVLMCANNKYAFADVVRRLKCGVRGSMINLEQRLDKLFADNQVPRILNNNSVKMDTKTITDIDVVNRWINQHIMQQAIFTVPILPTGANSALTKLLVDLNNPTTRAAAVNSIMLGADALSNNAFSAAANTNLEKGSETKGWNVTKPIFHASNQLVIDGTAKFEGELFNLGEIDEMSAHRMAGPNGAANADLLLRTLYQQTDREDNKARQQRIRIMLTESMNLTDVNINAFGRVVVMDPGFMNLWGTVMSQIGTLNTSSIQGNFMNDNAIFAPGVNLAVDYVAGVNTVQQGGGIWDAYAVV